MEQPTREFKDSKFFKFIQIQVPFSGLLIFIFENDVLFNN